MHAYNWETIPAERLSDLIVRRMVVGDKEMLVRWEFRKNALAARHNHPHEQVVLMISGRLRLAVGDDETVMQPNDVVVIPPNVPHEAEALEDTVVIDIFCPPREDFLSGGPPAYLNP